MAAFKDGVQIQAAMKLGREMFLLVFSCCSPIFQAFSSKRLENHECELDKACIDNFCICGSDDIDAFRYQASAFANAKK